MQRSSQKLSVGHWAFVICHLSFVIGSSPLSPSSPHSPLPLSN
ncbi:MAG: hypothetical protein V7K27_33120 [Nostoc sp.]